MACDRERDDGPVRLGANDGEENETIFESVSLSFFESDASDSLIETLRVEGGRARLHPEGN